ncbi:HAD family hydrolase [Ignatzschineria rhizosphaerae]|uniref:HAD family hydrolase n=1 Tax=Ignatzschineria rhizosphaerae TaxID=2923279 RepID=A0ABY3X653_9GAMM|nr:HAD family hydrolase [Ignatzschineria rhizosphaerae]UNM97375.1 HAD family hydrolase [Ignatzschineria rhizosphaerae]
MSFKDIRHIRHWIFDMDGTLTIAVHDFSMIKKVLEIPEEEDILVNLEKLPEADKNARLRWLAEYELKMAKQSIAATGAPELLTYLNQQSSDLAILTRNLQDLAFITLEAIEADHYFEKSLIFGRENAAPKPSPDGILQIIEKWGISPTETVIVGDHEYDLASGKNAGIQTILVNHESNIYPELADFFFPSCHDLLAYLQNQ